MERPFSNKRPIGPFVGQSDSFRDAFLSNQSRDGTFKELDRGIIEVHPIDSRIESRADKEYRDIISELVEGEFEDHLTLQLENYGVLDGFGSLSEVFALTYHVHTVRDSEVTISQVESAIQTKLGKRGMGVQDVIIHNSRMK